MRELLKTVLSLSLSGSVLILLLLALGPLIQNRLGKGWRYYLWLVVVARLLLPFGPAESPVGNLFRSAENPIPETAATQEDHWTVPPRTDSLPEPVSPSAQAIKGEKILSYLWVVWLGGAAALFLRKITVYQDFARYIKAGKEEVTDVAQLDLLAKTGEELGVGRPVELWTHSLISSPLLLGLFHPAIVLPTADLSPADLRYTAAHELIHYKRKDLLYKWVVQAALCVHWFNPLVWLMAWETIRDCELSCDEAVMKRLTPEERQGYGDALLRAMGTGGNYQSSLASVTLAESGQRLKERLGAILSFRGTTRGMAAAAACLAAVLVLGACAAGAYRPGSGEPGDPHPVAATPVPESQPKPVNETEPASPAGEEPSANEAERCYREEDLPGFAAAFPLLGETEKEKALARCYDDRNMAYFSAAANQLEQDSPLVEQLAERSYQDGRTNFFAALTWQMGEDTLESWLERAKEDSSVSFQMTLLGALGREEEMEALRAQLEQERLEELRAWGITKEGRHYSYKGKLIRVLVEVQPDRFQTTTLETNPQGEVDVQVLRNREGNIREVSEMPKGQLDQYFAEDRVDNYMESHKESVTQERLEEYKKWGITVEGKEYRWNGRLARIFLDLEGNSSFYTLEKNPQGEVDVKVTRSGDGRILTVAEMSEAEAAELLADWADPDDEEESGVKNNSLEIPGADWQTQVVPVELETLGPGEYAWLGNFTLQEGDWVSYQVAAKTGDWLTVGFAKEGETAPEVTFYTVSDPGLQVDSGFLIWQSPAPPGEYLLFVQAGEQPLGGVTGKVVIVNVLETEN